MQSFKPTFYLIAICVSASLIPSTVVCEKLLLTVYYESLCPDSVRFIKEQVYPVYTEMSNFIQLDLVPYGFADSTIYPNGTVTFTCQHGPKECSINKLHACALTHLEMGDAIPFIHCTIGKKSSATSGLSDCKTENPSYNNVHRCVESEEGGLLLAAYGMRTKHVDWVPWIMFNNIVNKKEMDACQGNLQSCVCKKLESPNRPPACYR